MLPWSAGQSCRVATGLPLDCIKGGTVCRWLVSFPSFSEGSGFSNHDAFQMYQYEKCTLPGHLVVILVAQLQLSGSDGQLQRALL